MKKHLIVGNPISHSLSPKIHNYWFKIYNVKAEYEKSEIQEREIKDILDKLKEGKIYGMNVTVPFKQAVIPYLETQSALAIETKSVNTIYKKNGKVHGENTDVHGFEKSIIENKINITDKKVLIFGSGGVVPSVISALQNLKIGKIYLSNRTYKNAEVIKKQFSFIDIIEWGKIENCDVFINCTSVGLKKDDNLKVDFNKLKGKKIFYDIIYNPSKTRFLLEAEKSGHKIFNGRDMFLFQAQKAFHLWHNIMPEIDQKLINYLYHD